MSVKAPVAGPRTIAIPGGSHERRDRTSAYLCVGLCVKSCLLIVEGGRDG